MCGICGAVSYSKNNLIEEGQIRKMCAALTHRGPDDEGIFIDKQGHSVGLGHRRLSIIDLSGSGHQPMSNEDSSVWITFNGEIYNFHELRPRLEKAGHSFSSNSDTEAIIHLYEDYGAECVKHLRGMFAFAIWDKRRKALLLARDRIGKKPLLYCRQAESFYFASEFTSLLAGGAVTKKINKSALDYYLSFGYIPAPLTIYENVYKLLPAHTLLLNANGITLSRYWQPDYSSKIRISEEDAAEGLLSVLKEAVKMRLYSEVPLGAFLSGGIDSSTVVGLMSGFSAKIKTFSIGFEEKDYNELKFARNIARRFSTQHNEFVVRPKALEVLPLLVERYGEPYADSSSIPTYYLCRETRKFVTVALNGDGGDELFAGYERYQAMLISGAYQRVPELVRSIVRKLSAALPDSADQKNKLRRLRRFMEAIDLPLRDRYIRWVSIFDAGLKDKLYSPDFSSCPGDRGGFGLIASHLEGLKSVGLLDTLLMTDTSTYLPDDLLVKVDIASMANSLEARSPFLDHKVIEFAASLPEAYKMKRLVKKYILKKAIAGFIPKENTHRQKMGFGMPVGRWFRQELKDFLVDTLLSGTCLKRGYFNPQTVKELVNGHISAKKDFSFQLWSLLMLELWHQRFYD
ncbi:asparagine synthase (glutamine-hydrolyzing) [bacterium]|nr:MAG: asparagine synthase (glutamine-hydrolyzing) [bacterium]